MTQNLVETKGLCKSYGGALRVKDLHMQVPEGAIYGFLGPERRRKVHHLENDPRPGASYRRRNRRIRQTDECERPTGYLKGYWFPDRIPSLIMAI